ncbi:hypothetical protein PENTCL1PPCAC_5887, partial [Pristionchus entomophagus]
APMNFLGYALPTKSAASGNFVGLIRRSIVNTFHPMRILFRTFTPCFSLVDFVCLFWSVCAVALKARRRSTPNNQWNCSNDSQSERCNHSMWRILKTHRGTRIQ